MSAKRTVYEPPDGATGTAGLVFDALVGFLASGARGGVAVGSGDCSRSEGAARLGMRTVGTARRRGAGRSGAPPARRG